MNNAGVRPLKLRGLVSEELEGLDEIIYANAESGATFSLNPTAAAILDLCDGERSHDDLASILHETTHVDLQRAKDDVATILAEFAENSLIYAADTPDEQA